MMGRLFDFVSVAWSGFPLYSFCCFALTVALVEGIGRNILPDEHRAATRIIMRSWIPPFCILLWDWSDDKPYSRLALSVPAWIVCKLVVLLTNLEAVDAREWEAALEIRRVVRRNRGWRYYLPVVAAVLLNIVAILTTAGIWSIFPVFASLGDVVGPVVDAFLDWNGNQNGRWRVRIPGMNPNRIRVYRFSLAPNKMALYAMVYIAYTICTLPLKAAKYLSLLHTILKMVIVHLFFSENNRGDRIRDLPIRPVVVGGVALCYIETKIHSDAFGGFMTFALAVYLALSVDSRRMQNIILLWFLVVAVLILVVVPGLKASYYPTLREALPTWWEVWVVFKGLPKKLFEGDTWQKVWVACKGLSKIFKDDPSVC